LLLDKLAVLEDRASIVRLGQSMVREDLNSKYTLEITRKNDAAAYERVQKRMEHAKIVIAATFSLR